MRRRTTMIGIAAALLAAAAIGAALAFGRGGSHPPVTGEVVDLAVPQLELVDEHGASTTLSSFRDKVVVFAPFLTLCHEVCPLTTGAFEAMQRAVERAGLGDKVVFAEVSVDPWRDTPARLRAFARLTGVPFPLFTGSKQELARFWHTFGVAYWRTKEGTPADTDWMTGKPLTFDVAHTDGFFVLGADGRWRIVDVGMPHGAKLSRVLLGLLSAEGRRDLHRTGGTWTVQEALDDVGYLLGQRIPLAA